MIPRDHPLALFMTPISKIFPESVDLDPDASASGFGQGDSDDDLADNETSPDAALFHHVWGLTFTSFSSALAYLRQHPSLSFASSALLFERCLRHLDTDRPPPRGVCEFVSHLIESGVFAASFPPDPSADLNSEADAAPHPLSLLFELSPGQTPASGPLDSQPLSAPPYRHNPAIWGAWMIQLVSQQPSSAALQDALFDALIQLPHPKPVLEALAAGLARKPDPLEMTRRFDCALKTLAGLNPLQSRQNPKLALALAYACDQWAAMDAQPSRQTPKAAVRSLHAASLFGCGRVAIHALLAMAQDSGALSESLLISCSELSANSLEQAQPGRALGALFSCSAWTPEGRQAQAFKLCSDACSRGQQALFSTVSPHCDWSALAPKIRSSFSAAFLARCEQEALRSKKISGQASSDPDQPPRPKRSVSRL